MYGDVRLSEIGHLRMQKCVQNQQFSRYMSGKVQKDIFWQIIYFY